MIGPESKKKRTFFDYDIEINTYLDFSNSTSTLRHYPDEVKRPEQDSDFTFQDNNLIQKLKNVILDTNLKKVTSKQGRR